MNRAASPGGPGDDGALRVSVDVGHAGLPGVGRFATELAAALERLDGSLSVVRTGTSGGAVELLCHGGMTKQRDSTTARRAEGTEGGLRSAQTVRAWMRRAGVVRLPAGVAVHHATHLGVPLRARPGVAVVLTVHDLFPLTERRHSRSAAGRAYHRAVLPAAVRRAGAVVAVSEYTAAELERVLGRRADAVIGHGVDHLAWQGAPTGPEALPAGVRPPYLLYVGTAKWHKNLATLLAAHRGAPGLPPLVLAGPSAREVNAALPGAVAGSRLVVLGPVADRGLPALYAGAAAVAVPSLYEGFGLTALEAMSFGAPVAAADSPGLAETVGDAAVLVPARDPAAWADALARLAAGGTVREVVAERGRRRAASRTWDAAAAAYAEVYARAAGRARASEGGGR